MLKFPCLCGHQFSLDESLAGSQFQCPSCGRLVDTPTLGEIHTITPEGTYVLDMAPTPPEPKRLRELRMAFSREKLDETGFQIDLRPGPADLEKIGIPEIPFADEDPNRPAKPKYDPISGELIRPLTVRGDDPVKASQIPMAKAVLVYASPGVTPRLSPTRLMYQLLLPHNLAVLLFLALFHLLFVLTLIPLVAGFFFVGILSIGLLFGIIGHYSNVIQDTGPGEKDEIPRPLRQGSFHEDMWMPFVYIVLTFMICYGPALAVALSLVPHPGWEMIAGIFLLAGSFFVPAVLMTAATSGTISNLRPDRVWGVITTARWNYLTPVAAYIAGMVFYLVGISAVVQRTAWTLIHFGSKTVGPHPYFIPNAFVGYGVILFGMYLLHLACWQMGLIWRAHNADFPWIAQRHTPLTHKQKLADVDSKRAAARLKYEERQAQRRAARQLGGR